MQERHIDLAKLPVSSRTRRRATTTVHLDLACNGSDATLQINQSFDADPEIANWLNNADFRRALSLGIDRDQLNETFWLGVGTPGSRRAGRELAVQPGPGVAQEVVDARRRAGQRAARQDRPDQEGRRRLPPAHRQASGCVHRDARPSQAVRALAAAGEMIAQQWQKIGIRADVKEIERNLACTPHAQQRAPDLHVGQRRHGDALPVPAPRHPGRPDRGVSWGREYAQWYATGGAQGKKPDDPQMLKIFELFRRRAGQQTDERIKTAQEIWKILVDQQYSIGTVGLSPALMGVRIVKNNLGNIPARAFIAQHCRTPGSSQPVTFFYQGVTARAVMRSLSRACMRLHRSAACCWPC